MQNQLIPVFRFIVDNWIGKTVHRTTIRELDAFSNCFCMPATDRTVFQIEFLCSFQPVNGQRSPSFELHIFFSPTFPRSPQLTHGNVLLLNILRVPSVCPLHTQRTKKKKIRKKIGTSPNTSYTQWSFVSFTSPQSVHHSVHPLKIQTLNNK